MLIGSLGLYLTLVLSFFAWTWAWVGELFLSEEKNGLPVLPCLCLSVADNCASVTDNDASDILGSCPC